MVRTTKPEQLREKSGKKEITEQEVKTFNTKIGYYT